jgi:DNA-directed RNA polymerase specialized sigma24 family protein
MITELAKGKTIEEGAQIARKDVANALDGLPPEYRLLLLLVADKELSYDEVAALTQQTTDAVRGKLHRARKAFAVHFRKTA